MHSLQPFDSSLPRVFIDGEFRQKDDLITVDFLVRDPNKLLLELPTKFWTQSEMQRTDGLWKNFCLESFWSEAGSENYFELNLSLNGCWNLYEFIGYRSPQPPKASQAFQLIDVKARKINASEESASEPNDRVLSVQVRLKSNSSRSNLEYSLCAVVPTHTPAGNSYFSTAHKGPKPDFHLRNSFNLAAI